MSGRLAIRPCLTDEEYPLSEFVYHHGERLPVVISATEGYSGVNNLHTISTGDMFLVYHVTKQRRVVVRDENAKLYSIPANYAQPFHLVKKNKQISDDAMSIQDALMEAKRNPRVWGDPATVVLEDGDTLNLLEDAVNGKVISFRQLSIVDSYDEAYLLAQSILQGMVAGRHVTLPTYMKISYDVLIGFEQVSDEEFLQWLQGMYAVAFGSGAKAEFCNDIVLLKEIRTSNSNTTNIYERVMALPQAPAAGGHHGMYIGLRKGSDPDQTKQPSPGHIKQSSSIFRRSTTKQGGAERTSAGKSVSLDPSRYSMLPHPQQPVSLFNRSQSAPVGNSPDQAGKPVLPPRQNRNSMFPQTKAKALPPLPSPDSSPSTTRRENPPCLPPTCTSKTNLPHDVDSLSATQTVNLSSLPPPTTKLPDDVGSLSTTRKENLPSTTDDVGRMSVEDLSSWLQKLHLEGLVDTFQQQQVDGALLQTMDEEMLTTDFKLSKFEAKKLIAFAKQGWRPNCSDDD